MLALFIRQRMWYLIANFYNFVIFKKRNNSQNEKQKKKPNKGTHSHQNFDVKKLFVGNKVYIACLLLSNRNCGALWKMRYIGYSPIWQLCLALIHRITILTHALSGFNINFQFIHCFEWVFIQLFFSLLHFGLKGLTLHFHFSWIIFVYYY